MLKKIVWILAAFVFVPSLIFAQSPEEIAAREARLRAELAQVEKDIAQQKTLLSSKQKETASIQRDIDILTYKINTAKLNIKAKQIEIERLGTDIGNKKKTIVVLGDKLDKERETLAELLRKNRELDDTSLIEVSLASSVMSDLFADILSFNFLENSVNASLDHVRTTKDTTERQKLMLEDRQAKELAAKKAIEQEKAKVESLTAEKNKLLKVSKSQESAYKLVIADKEKQRQEILSALFRLRGAQSITFGEALEHAKNVSARTGVRPAFLMAILTQESNLGQNVGTCNRPGDPPSKNWKAVMKPTRDYAPFERITKELGLDPDTMPVSCPLGGSGYGGAMGPAQFIPSTWELYKAKIAAATGHNPPNPWNAGDAFMASGIYLKELGAGDGGYTAEKRAALKYYAGSGWNKPQNAFYGNQVMAIAERYQGQIDILQGN